MVQEKSDHNRWTLPGGWADIGYTPFEIAVKEAREETGLETEAVRLLALLDKKQHAHPPQPWYVYKAFVLCRVIGGSHPVRHQRNRRGALGTPPRAGCAGAVHRPHHPARSWTTCLPLPSNPDLPALCD